MYPYGGLGAGGGYGCCPPSYGYGGLGGGFGSGIGIFFAVFIILFVLFFIFGFWCFWGNGFGPRR